jgi:hypothetical protein
MEEGEDGEYGKNGKEVRSGIAQRKQAGQETRVGGRQISLKRRSWGKEREEEEEEYHVSWRLGASIYIVQ